MLSCLDRKFVLSREADLAAVVPVSPVLKEIPIQCEQPTRVLPKVVFYNFHGFQCF